MSLHSLFRCNISPFVNGKSMYVLTNIFVSGVSFIRSFIFMRGVTDLSELGVLAIAQTVIMFIGMLQFGLINGGYRVFSLGNENNHSEVNNTLYSYFFLLAFFLLGLIGLLSLLKINLGFSIGYLLIIVFAGVLTLIQTWQTNSLIGKRKLTVLNIINIVSSGISLLLLPTVFLFGLKGAIILLVFQPLIFTITTLIKFRDLRPTFFVFSKTTALLLLKYGFVPFLSGIFVLLIMQIERWSLLSYLGTAALGEYYLCFLFASLFVMVPNSLNSIFFPLAIRAYENQEFVYFKSVLRKYSIILLGYAIIVLALTFLLLNHFVSILFPLHLKNVFLVYLTLPGLILQSFTNPISLVMNSMVKLKLMFTCDFLSLTIYILFIFLLAFSGDVSISNIALSRSILGFVSLALYLIFYINNRQHFNAVI